VCGLSRCRPADQILPKLSAPHKRYSTLAWTTLTQLSPMLSPPYACWYRACVSDGGISSLTINSITLRYLSDMSSPTIFLHWNITTWQGQMMWFSLWWETIDGTSAQISRIAILSGISFVLIRFSWVLIQPLYTKCGLNQLQHALLGLTHRDWQE